MTDIVERLRDLTTAAIAPERRTILEEATDEIERLRTLLAEVDGLLACHAHVLDPAPRERWPKDSILGKAVDRHDGAVLRV